MLRLPDNHSCIATGKTDTMDHLKIAIAENLWPNVSVVVGYGPSYGIDTKALELLKEGKRLEATVLPIHLIVVRHRVALEPRNHYTWYSVTVEEFAYKNFAGELTGEIEAWKFHNFLLENIQKLPTILHDYVLSMESRRKR